MRLKHVIISLSCLTLAIGTVEFCKKKTAGFAVWKVQDNFGLAHPEKSRVCLPQEIDILLNQSYKYLGRGKQSFVFASEDGKYVLKLFNNHYQRKTQYFSLLSHIPFLGTWARQKAEYNKHKLHLTFTSYSIALSKLKDETGILYVHTSPKEKSSFPLHIVDKLGIHHKLPVEKSAFLLQKRAEAFYPSLLSLKKRGDDQKAKLLLDSLFDLLITRYSKGIFDNDPLLRTNFGFVGDQAVEIDVGPFSENPSMKDPAIYSKEIVRITTSLRLWLEENYTELLPELENQCQFKLQSQSS